MYLKAVAQASCPEIINNYLVTAKCKYGKEIQKLKLNERAAGTFLFSLLEMNRNMGDRLIGVKGPVADYTGINIASCRPISYGSDWIEELPEGDRYPRFTCHKICCVWCWIRRQTAIRNALPKYGVMAISKSWVRKPTNAEYQKVYRMLRAKKRNHKVFLRITKPNVDPTAFTAYWLLEDSLRDTGAEPIRYGSTFKLIHRIFQYPWKLTRLSGVDLDSYLSVTKGMSLKE